MRIHNLWVFFLAVNSFQLLAVELPDATHPASVSGVNLKWEFDDAINVNGVIVNSGSSLLIRSNIGADVRLKAGTILASGSEVNVKSAPTVVYLGGSTIAPNDPNVAGKRLIIRPNGPSIDVAIKGTQRLSELVLEAGANLIVYDPATPARLDLQVDGDIYIAQGSRIDASAAGMLPNATDPAYGITQPTRGGGSHGGWGSPNSGGSNTGLSYPYGSFLVPNEPGQAGNGAVSRGGGVITILARKLYCSGRISANGASSTGVSAGGGAGGSIYINVKQLEQHPSTQGSNVYSTIQADGGWPYVNTSISPYALTGGGGGGRISIYYQQEPSLNLPPFPRIPLNGVFTLSVLGYQADSSRNVGGVTVSETCTGNSGTIYLKKAGSAFGSLVLNAALVKPTLFSVPFRQPTPIFLGSVSATPYTQPATGEDFGIYLVAARKNGSFYQSYPTQQGIDWVIAGDPSVFDRDRDGLASFEELVYGTNPGKADTNDDGILDGPSITAGINATNMDQDGDGLSNADERLRGTNPFNPDSDGDGSNDMVDGDPLNPARTSLPPTSGDVTPPVITIESPRVTPLN